MQSLTKSPFENPNLSGPMLRCEWLVIFSQHEFDMDLNGKGYNYFPSQNIFNVLIFYFTSQDINSCHLLALQASGSEVLITKQIALSHEK